MHVKEVDCIFLLILCVNFQVTRAFAANKAWIIGFLVDICSALLILRALSQAPVSEYILFPIPFRLLCLIGNFHISFSEKKILY